MSWQSKAKTFAKYTNPFVAAGDLVKDVVDPKTDVISGVGRDQDPSKGYVQGASTGSGAYPGAMYFDENSGNLETYDGNNWTPSAPKSNTNVNGWSGTGGGSAAPAGPSAADQEELAYINDQEGLLRQLLSRADTGLNQGLTNLQDSYNKEKSGVNQQRSRALENFDLKRQDTTRGKEQAIGRVDTNARTLSDSVRRLLGMASGTGSSAYQITAPGAIARDASMKRSGVQENYGENFRDLSLSENRAKTDFEELLESLDSQRKQREQQLRTGILEQKQGVQGQLADLARQRTAVQGGNYNAMRSASAPFQQNIDNASRTIDSLFEKYRSPKLAVDPVQVQTPELRDYTVDRAAINQNQGANPSAASPYAQFLQRQREEEQRA